MESPIGPIVDKAQGTDYLRHVIASLESPIGGGGSEGGAAAQLPAAPLGFLESPIAPARPAVAPADWLVTPPDGLPDGRRQSAANLPIVYDANGVFSFGPPDDLRYFNGGIDKWARNPTCEN